MADTAPSGAAADSVSEAAARYAAAVFDLGLESKSLESLEKDFNTLKAAFAASGDLREAAASPLIEPEEKAKALVAVADKLGLSTLGRNLVGVVARNGRAVELPAIAAAFAKRLAAHRNQSQVEIVSAAPLNNEEVNAILAGLKQSLGRDVEAVTRVDASLLGGFIVRAGSRQFDASLKTKLQTLKLALKGA